MLLFMAMAAVAPTASLFASPRFLWQQAATSHPTRHGTLPRASIADGDNGALEAEVQALGAPSTELERQQRHLIEMLMERQGLVADVAALESDKASCERTLVTLPAEIVQLRETTGALGAVLAELKPAMATLESEQARLGEQQAREGAHTRPQKGIGLRRGLPRARTDRLNPRTASLAGGARERGREQGGPVRVPTAAGRDGKGQGARADGGDGGDDGGPHQRQEHAG